MEELLRDSRRPQGGAGRARPLPRGQLGLVRKCCRSPERLYLLWLVQQQGLHDAAVDGTETEFTLYAGWKAEAQPGAGENGGNDGNSSANANANANTANSNSSNKGNLPQTGDSLTLVGSALALAAAVAALIAASLLRHKEIH